MGDYHDVSDDFDTDSFFPDVRELMDRIKEDRERLDDNSKRYVVSTSEESDDNEVLDSGHSNPETEVQKEPSVSGGEADEDEDLQTKYERAQETIKYYEGLYTSVSRALIKKNMTEKLNILMAHGEAPEVVQRSYDDLQSTKARLLVDNTKGLFYWVTINPPDSPFEDIWNAVERLKERKLFKHMIYAYEQRGVNQDEQGKGVHVHIILKKIQKDMKPNSIFRWIRSTFSSFFPSDVKDSLMRKYICIKSFNASYFNDKMDYLKGIKWDDSKNQSIEITKQWRKTIGIEDIYQPV